MHVRKERVDDLAAIRKVTMDAFDRPEEANLVDALRVSGDLPVSLVAELNGRIIGQIALSRLKSPDQALALAPVSVLTSRQHRGAGSLLIRASLERARRLGYEIVFVLGKPEYYCRFGFSAKVAAEFPCPYAGPYFMALWLSDARRAPEQVSYADAFDDFE